MTNLERLQKVAEGLEELNEQVVYVGGSLPGLYSTDSAAPEPRATTDVDCIVRFGNHVEKEKFEERLRSKHFSEDQSENAVICRWNYEGEIVDIMPTDERFFSFTNRWYETGMNSKERFTLPNGMVINILSVVTFVATKLEALRSRGGDDLRGEKDFEDIVYILDCCADFPRRMMDEHNEELKSFVVQQLNELLQRPNIVEEIECALPIGDENRCDIVIQAIRDCLSCQCRSSQIRTCDFPECKGVVVCGDIHGDFTQLVFKCCVQYGMTDTLIIVAGDCGFGFDRPGYYEGLYRKCSKRLSKANNWLSFIRGNHDNPAYFNHQPITHQRWMTIPDYSIVKACGHTILCVGGATSVDRTRRMEVKQYHLPNPKDPLIPNVYWPDEQPFFDKAQLDIINEQCAIDIVVTHSSPSFCERSSHLGLEAWAMDDEHLLDDVKYERQVMDDIYHYLYEKNHPLQSWYYGHFHESWHAEIDGVMFHMLDILELREIYS